MDDTTSLRSAVACLGLAASAWLVGCGSPSNPTGPPPPPPVPESPHRITVIRLGGEQEPAEVPPRSVKAGLELYQFEEGKHFAIEVVDLGGDPDAAPGAIDRAARSGGVVVLTHPLLLPAASSRDDAVPIVFGVLGDPRAFGVGESDDRHRPGLTGAYNPLPARSLLTLVTFYLPDARRIGLVHDPDDPLSVAHKDALLRDADEANVEVVASESVDDLFSGPLDAVCLAFGSPPGLLERASAEKIPAFGITEAQALAGAVAGEVPQPDRVGVQVGRMVHAVLDGKSPDTLPLSPVFDSEIVVNLQILESLGIPLPPAALRISRPVGGGPSASSE